MQETGGRMPGVVYPDRVPVPDGPPPDADPADERAMALRFVRTAFDPPLPDPFADWLLELHRVLRDGGHAETLVTVPEGIIALGYAFEHATPAPYGVLHMTLVDALRLFGRDDLVWDAPGAAEQSLDGATALATALLVYGIRTTTTLHRAGGCTVQLTDAQAQRLADVLIPVEGSPEDHLAEALGLVDAFTDKPRPLPCAVDHHGHCQEHHRETANDHCAQPLAYALLVRHGVREEEP